MNAAPLVIICNAVFLASLLTLSHSLLKWVAVQPNNGYFDLLFVHRWIIFCAISMYIFIFFYYTNVLRTVPLGVLYPAYTGLSIIFVVIAGGLLFDEKINFIQIFGCLLITCGIILSAMSQK